MLPGWSLYLFHGVFWASFVVTLLVTRRPGARNAHQVSSTASSSSELTAPHSLLLVAIHAFAFGVMYLD